METIHFSPEQCLAPVRLRTPRFMLQARDPERFYARRIPLFPPYRIVLSPRGAFGLSVSVRAASM